MAYIYKITNEITNQCYIGQTGLSIEKRFLEHVRASRLTKNKKRPLYKAFNDYGISNFHLEMIEETDNPNERENIGLIIIIALMMDIMLQKVGKDFQLLIIKKFIRFG